MATSSFSALRTIGRLLQQGSPQDIVARIAPVFPAERPLPADIPEQRSWSNAATALRRELVARIIGTEPVALAGQLTVEDHATLRGNIEHFVGMTQLPTGLIGPLRINGVDASGDFYVPMATTEGALVASYNRGAGIVSRAGGVASVCLTEAVQRSPVFEFRTFGDCGLFLIWVLQNAERLREIVTTVSSHAKLEEIRPNIDGNHISLVLEFTTGEAAGQNMVTLCADAICHFITEHTPIVPASWYVEGNLSGDKKATSMSFASVRGKKVTAECELPRELVESVLHTTPEAMINYWQTSVLNGVQSGSIGVNGHFANGLAAIFCACGQDVACVSEAAVGITRFNRTDAGGLYAAVTLPNLIVGTVGGGTHLPTQRECLAMLGCVGEGSARKLAEICAAAVLCGEISIVGAIAAGDFAKAHALYGRRREGARS